MTPDRSIEYIVQFDQECCIIGPGAFILGNNPIFAKWRYVRSVVEEIDPVIGSMKRPAARQQYANRRCLPSALSRRNGG